MSVIAMCVCMSCAGAVPDRGGPSSLPSDTATMSEVGRVSDDVHLPPEQASGSRYCLDPESQRLRELIRREPPAADTLLERDALARDVGVLHQILKKQYAGYPELLQHRRFDVEAFFARWADELRAGAGSIRFHAGVIQYLVALKRAHLDQHLQPFGWGGRLVRLPELAVAEYQALVERAGLSQCRFPDDVHGFAHTVRTSVMLMPDGTSGRMVTATVQGHGDETVTLRCGADAIELRRRGDARESAASGGATREPAYEWRSIGATALVIIRRFHGSPEAQALLEQIAEDYEQHRTHRTIVFDLRDNGGGNDGYFFAWLERAKRGAIQVGPSVEIEGLLHPCRDWNAAVYSQILYDVVDTAEAREERDKLRAEWPAQVPDIHHRVFPGVLQLDAKHPYDGRVIVLVNRSSASSAESTAAALRAGLGALLVGERTAGYLEYGNLQPLVLPHTGLLFWVPIRRYYYDSPVEGVGLPADYYLDGSLMQKPAEELLPLLERLPEAPLP